MEIKLSVETKTAAGEDHCGEDLFVIVKAELVRGEGGDIETTLQNVVRGDANTFFLRALDKALKACIADLPHTASDREEICEADGLYIDNIGSSTRVRSLETEYGFKVDWSLDEFETALYKTCLHGDWKKDFKTGRCTVEKEFYIAGNAE